MTIGTGVLVLLLAKVDQLFRHAALVVGIHDRDLLEKVDGVFRQGIALDPALLHSRDAQCHLGSFLAILPVCADATSNIHATTRLDVEDPDGLLWPQCPAHVVVHAPEVLNLELALHPVHDLLLLVDSTR